MRNEKALYFCTRFEKQIKVEIKKEDYVPRHIELTAVSMRIETKRIRVIESEDLRKTTRPSVK